MKKNTYCKYFGFAFLLVLALSFFNPAAANAKEKASNLKELVEIVTQHGLKRDTKEFAVKYTGPEKDIEYVVENKELAFFYDELVMYDDPSTSDDADYLSANLNVFTDDFELYSYDNVIYFKMKYYDTLSQSQYVNENIPKILDDLGVSSMSNYEKVLTIHDYVCELIKYDDSKKDSVSTMYGALKNGKALCNAYSICIYKLLVESGVPCKIIGGTAGTGRDSGGHAWNIVALGDKWYYLDATWDDNDKKNDPVNYDYFLKGSQDFDEAEPDEKHKLDEAYRKGMFAKAFPMAKTAFDPYTMSDENVKIKIGDSETHISQDADGGEEKVDKQDKYKLKDIVSFVYPVDGKISFEKGEYEWIWVCLNDGMEDLVKSVSYKINTGKKRISKVKNNGLVKDQDGVSAELELYCKQKGKVSITIILKLVNGQKLKCTFKGSIK